MFKEVEIEQKELLMEVEKRLDEIRSVEITDFGCFHPTPQKCKILKPSFLQT